MLILGTVILQIVQAAQPPRFPDFPKQDALSYSLDLKLNLEKPHLSGSIEYRIKALAELSKLRFHARRSDSWRVDFEDTEGRPLQSDWLKNEVHVTLPEPAAKDSVVVLRARIAGLPVDGFYFKKSRYGKMMAFTDHYSIRARGWLPCEDHPADRASWKLRMVYPKGLQATAYGQRLDDPTGPVPDGFEVMESVSDTQVPPYMFALIVGSFVLIPETGDPRLRPHLVYQQDAKRARSSLRHHAKWMKIMEQTFGVYSYKKYTTAQCPTRWGGFEAPGNVQLS
ncbi:MAG: hypothetical protein VX951_11620, partial [Planctomycetota bacterium]|nr:hypothetical protein [Planctomycetota bacterium]